MATRTILITLTALTLVAAGTAPRHTFIAEPLLAQGQQPDEFSITLRNAAVHQKVGMPDFLVPAGDAELAAAARTIADVLWNDIDFEREFYMIPRKSSAAIPVAPVNALPYDRWVELGADAVLVGSITRNGDEVAVELRMIGVRGASQGKQGFGKAYPNCRLSNPRFCAHSIADDFHKEVRQLDGVARTKLAFVSDRDATRVVGRPSQTQAQGKEIYIADYDGANQLRLTVNRSLNISPAWGPGGNLLAYTSYLSGFPDIYITNLATPGRALERPAQGDATAQNQMAAWSPDGSRIAFTSNRDGNMDVYVVNRDGTGLRNLTPGRPEADFAPTWSPDGGQIAFISDRAGTNQLYVMNATGSGQNRLSGEKADRPTWSSLRFIAFTVGSGPGHDIAIWDFNNPGVKILTDGVGSNEGPAVSPNGRHLAFFTTRWGKQHIAVMDRDGKNIRQITEVGNNTFPNWQPAASR
jgi:TolB protein